jgi:hypothetical protein
VALNVDDVIWDVTVFTESRKRLLAGDIAEAFFQAVLNQAHEPSLLSDEHLTVDGALPEAWARVKSYQRKDAENAVPPDKDASVGSRPSPCCGKSVSVESSR